MAAAQPLGIYITCTKRLGRLTELHASTHTVNAVFAVHLVAVTLALLVGFLLFQYLYHLGIGFGQVECAIYLDTQIVKVLLILALQQVFKQAVALVERLIAIIECLLVRLKRGSYKVYLLL